MTNPTPNQFVAIWSRFPRDGAHWSIERTYPHAYAIAAGGFGLPDVEGKPVESLGRLYAWFNVDANPNTAGAES